MQTIQHIIRHKYTSLAVLFVVFWTPVILFFRIAGEVVERQPIAIDIAILTWLHAHASPLLDRFFFAVTTLGGIIGIALLTLSLACYFIYRRQYRRTLLLLGSVGGAALANVILKGLFHRDRPSLFRSSVVETSFSFPSGHAMASSAFALYLILLFWPTRWRWLVVALGGLFIVAVGISRPYFGVHYPSDIIAGWCASAVWVTLVFVATDRIHRRLKRSVAPQD